MLEASHDHKLEFLTALCLTNLLGFFVFSTSGGFFCPGCKDYRNIVLLRRNSVSTRT